MASARPVKKVHDLGMNGGPLDDAEQVPTRWTTDLSSKVNLPPFKALCGANLVTLPSSPGVMQSSEEGARPWHERRALGRRRTGPHTMDYKRFIKSQLASIEGLMWCKFGPISPGM